MAWVGGEWVGGEKGRRFYTGEGKPKRQLAYLLQLYRFSVGDLSGLHQELEEELFLKPLRENNSAHFRRVSEAVLAISKFNPDESVEHYLFLARTILENENGSAPKKKDRKRIKELALRLWATYRLRTRENVHISNPVNPTPNEALLLREAIKKLPPVTWWQAWKAVEE